jgi:hypothetical protein
LYAVAHRTPFGTYTGSDYLRPYLLQLAKEGIAVVATDEVGRHYFYFIGTILRKR